MFSSYDRLKLIIERAYNVWPAVTGVLQCQTLKNSIERKVINFITIFLKKFCSLSKI